MGAAKYGHLNVIQYFYSNKKLGGIANNRYIANAINIASKNGHNNVIDFLTLKTTTQSIVATK